MLSGGVQLAALACALALAGQPAPPPPPGPPPAEEPPVEAAAPLDREPSAERRLGVALLAGGAALLITTATGVALLEGLTRPDDPDQKVEDPALLQALGVSAIGVGAVSAVLVLAGGALILSE